MKIIFTNLLIFFLAPVSLVSAQESSSSTPADTLFEYEETISIADGALYYQGEGEDAILVGSAHDTDADGDFDMWFGYQNDIARSEHYDTTGDGEPDVTVTLSPARDVTEISGEGAAAFERPLTERFKPAPIENGAVAGADLVGDLSDITIDEPDNNWIFFVLLFLVGGALYLFWKRQQ